VAASLGELPVPEEVDYVVVGSGAGGALMAYRLAQQVPDPSRVLVIERGPRHSPAGDSSDDELEMIRKLYKEGGLQQTKRFDVVVLQGECVGGTTVINNAICLEMPRAVRSRWEREFDLDLSALDGEYDRVATEVEIAEIDPRAVNQRVVAHFDRAVAGYNASVSAADRLQPTPLKANLRNPLGDGLCNLGNRRLRKRSMLETYVPWAEARGVRVVSETSAVCFLTQGRRAHAVVLRTDMGSVMRVRVRKAVVVAGGVISSSHFLMRSGVRGPVGRGMSCNFAFPVALDFADPVDAFDGLQIARAAADGRGRAIFETYFNPPGAMSITLPFHFDRLTEAMRRYRYLCNFGALVGSESNGVVERRAHLLDGRAFRWHLGERDRAHVRYALETLVRLGLAAGAQRCILPLSPGVELPLSARAVDDFCAMLERHPLGMTDLRLTTAHPQGGNRMAGPRSPVASERVVDENYRVVGFENVFVADASLFPCGITANPQWTILALSSLASSEVLRLTQA
jgi:choline dehydrogenase-like flavoprotein